MSLSINNLRKKESSRPVGYRKKEGAESRECEFAIEMTCMCSESLDSGKLLGNSVKPYTIRTVLNT